MRQPIRDLIVLKQVEVDGPDSTSRVDLLLDTGASVTILSRSVLESAGYNLEGLKDSLKLVTGNGSIELPMIRVDALRFGVHEVHDLVVGVHDIPGVGNIEGLLGVNALRHFRTVLDYPQGYMEITKP